MGLGKAPSCAERRSVPVYVLVGLTFPLSTPGLQKARRAWCELGLDPNPNAHSGSIYMHRID